MVLLAFIITILSPYRCKCVYELSCCRMSGRPSIHFVSRRLQEGREHSEDSSSLIDLGELSATYSSETILSNSLAGLTSLEIVGRLVYEL